MTSGLDLDVKSTQTVLSLKALGTSTNKSTALSLGLMALITKEGSLETTCRVKVFWCQRTKYLKVHGETQNLMVKVNVYLSMRTLGTSENGSRVN